jgi:hypothetical protein
LPFTKRIQIRDNVVAADVPVIYAESVREKSIEVEHSV